MIDTLPAIDCAFFDWGRKAKILDTDEEITVIYDDTNSQVGLGDNRFNTNCGDMLVYPTDANKLQEKYKVQLIDSGAIYVIERIKKPKPNEIRLVLSFYDETEVYNDFDFDE